MRLLTFGQRLPTQASLAVMVGEELCSYSKFVALFVIGGPRRGRRTQGVPGDGFLSRPGAVGGSREDYSATLIRRNPG